MSAQVKGTDPKTLKLHSTFPGRLTGGNVNGLSKSPFRSQKLPKLELSQHGAVRDSLVRLLSPSLPAFRGDCMQTQCHLIRVVDFQIRKNRRQINIFNIVKL